ncbi:hypothetical protein A4A49_41355 [Nicotiana attenuata]|uniref:Uncharacterized protein n=1 Tax=Nicotiana attenuata TaxID=49451 RepID=A0A1J6IX10_NICAT|nr:hypothetical protein A4A49_41355 [Nicotiana attenuata]
MKYVDAMAKKIVKRLSLASKTTTTAPKVSSDSCKRKERLVLSNQGSDREPSLVPFCDEKNHLPVLPNGTGDITIASSPVERESSEDYHIAGLFNDELGDDIIEDCFADIDDLGMTTKSSHKLPNDSKDHVMGGASSVELIPPRKPYSSSPIRRKFIQPDVTSEDVASTTEVMHRKSFRPSSWSLQPGDSSKEQLGTICRAKPTFVSVMWRGLCKWIKEFSVDSTDSFMKLEDNISFALTKIRRENIIDISTLADLVEAFSKTYAEYDAL